MNSKEVIRRMGEGFTLHATFLGFFLQSPHDNRCYNVNLHVSRSLLRKKLIRRIGEADQFELSRD